MTKLLNTSKQKKTDEFLRQVHDQLQRELSNQTLVVYLDEIMFTIRSVNTREFSNRNENIEMDFKSISVKTTAVIAAITFEHGVLYYECYDRSVNVDKFRSYLDNLRR